MNTYTVEHKYEAEGEHHIDIYTVEAERYDIDSSGCLTFFKRNEEYNSEKVVTFNKGYWTMVTIGDLIEKE